MCIHINWCYYYKTTLNTVKQILKGECTIINPNYSLKAWGWEGFETFTKAAFIWYSKNSNIVEYHYNLK